MQIAKPAGMIYATLITIENNVVNNIGIRRIQ